MNNPLSFFQALTLCAWPSMPWLMLAHIQPLSDGGDRIFVPHAIGFPSHCDIIAGG